MLKPLPVTETAVVTLPDVGDRAIVGPVTVNPADPISPVGPVTVRVYVPGVAPALTANPLPVTCPEALIVHVADPTMSGLDGDWPKVHVPASPELNPAPVTAI